MMAVSQANNSSQDYFRTRIGEDIIEGQFTEAKTLVAIEDKKQPVLLNGKPIKPGKDW